MSESLIHEAPALDSAPETANLMEQVLMSWPAQIKILNSPEVWKSMALALGISGLALGGLLWAVSGSAQGLLVGLGCCLFLVVLFVLVGIVIDRCGGFAVSFALTSTGIRSVSGKGAELAADAAFWTGLLAGSAGTAGAGLLARAEHDILTPYEDVTRVTVNAPRKYVHVKGALRSKPIGLSCTAENLPQVVQILKERCPGETVQT